MKKVFLFAAMLATLSSMSQTAVDNLDNWARQFPIEKVHLHLDRQSYYSGQTVWFKAYFAEGYVPSYKNSVLFVELLDNRSALIRRAIFPGFASISYGQLSLPDTLPSGSYQLRAYSPLMANQPDLIYSTRIPVYGKEPKTNRKNTTVAKAHDIDVQFFPEGGNFVYNLQNMIAFKAVDENGLPIDISGKITNNKNEVLTTISSLHDGMGSFSLIPLANETYTLTIEQMPGKTFVLPAATASGIALQIGRSERGKAFRITTNGNDETFRPAYMIGQMQNNVIFNQPFKSEKNEIFGIIPTKDILSGILHLTVFNKDGMPLAERLTFIDNDDYRLPVTLTTDTLDVGTRKINHFTLNIPDSATGHLSVSVTDADFEEQPYRVQNIYTSLMLTEDLKGYIHNPAYYFGSRADSVAAALDLVMMTHGWSRFKWSDTKANTLPRQTYFDPGYINFKGTVFLEGSNKKTFNDKDLMIMFKPKDSAATGFMNLIHTDSSGHFRIDSLMFFGQNSVLFSDVRGRKNKFIKVKMSADSLNKQYPVTPLNIPYKHIQTDSAIGEKMSNAFDQYAKEAGLMLENVTVKARVKSREEELDEKYASGLFSGGINSRSLDLTNETVGSLNIFDYLQGRLAGIMTTKTADGSYNVTFRRDNVTLFLDEMQTDAQFIESIPVSEIAYVKLLHPFVGTIGGGAALAIYRKTGQELMASIESSTDIINYQGYNITKEFYNPKYDAPHSDDEKADNRLTLFWNPIQYATKDNGHIPIVFYNNDRTKRFKVVVEGFMQDGRMIMLEQVVAP
ncbi:MAG: hypothetical protein QM727_11850 [Niabella sp.]